MCNQYGGPEAADFGHGFFQGLMQEDIVALMLNTFVMALLIGSLVLLINL